MLSLLLAIGRFFFVLLLVRGVMSVVRALAPRPSGRAPHRPPDQPATPKARAPLGDIVDAEFEDLGEGR